MVDNQDVSELAKYELNEMEETLKEQKTLEETKSVLFEMSFFANYKYWVRYFDGVKSVIKFSISQLWEYYEPSEKGKYKSLYNDDKYKIGYGNSQVAQQYESATSPADCIAREYKNYNHNPRILYFDIETRVGTCSEGFPKPELAYEPVCLIQFMDSLTKEIFIIGLKDFYFEDYYLKDYEFKVNYIKVEDEKALFNKFFQYLKDFKPLIVYAWNGSGFDFPYLYNRANKLNLSTNCFSPFYEEIKGKEICTLRKTEDGTYSLSAPGIFYFDMMKLYKKFILSPRSSYSLQSIAEVEINASKIDHGEFKTFDDFYKGNYQLPKKPSPEQEKSLCYQLALRKIDDERYDKVLKEAAHGKFIFYGVKDTELLYKLDDKLKLTNLITNLSERMKAQLSDCFGTVKIWEKYLKYKLKSLNLVATQTNYPVQNIVGGFVRTPTVGKKQWVLSADVNSMYPMLAISGSNISPETYINFLDVDPELKDFCIAKLKAGSENEQDEQNLLNLDPENLAYLKTLINKNNLTIAPNSAFFKKDKRGLIPDLVKEIYNERKITKKEKFKAEQKLIWIDEILENR